MGFMGFGGSGQGQGYPQDGYMQEPPSQANDVMSFGVAQQQSVEMIKYIMGKGDILKDMEYFLRGFVLMKDNDGMDYYGPDPAGMRMPLMNEKGVTVVLGMAMPLVEGKMFEISEFNSGEIRNMMIVWGDELLDNLISNSDEYGIDNSQVGLIYITVVQMVLSSLKKSEGG